MIHLARGQRLPLSDDAGLPRTRIQLGVGWDHIPTAGFLGTGAPEVDLDASAVEFTGERLFDVAFFNNVRTRDGAVEHQGDNRTGRGEGDDEVVRVDLTRVHAPVDRIVLLVTSYQGHTLEWINNAYCRLLDESGAELARLTLTGGIAETGVVMAVLERTGDHWQLRAVGDGIAATSVVDSVAALAPYVTDSPSTA